MNLHPYLSDFSVMLAEKSRIRQQLYFYVWYHAYEPDPIVGSHALKYLETGETFEECEKIEEIGCKMTYQECIGIILSI